MSRPLRVGIDGFALGLEKGTGVTSYSRNLSFALRDLGVEIDVLYGRKIASRGDRRGREVEFFDVAGTAAGPWRRRAQSIGLVARTLAGLIRNSARATEVPVRGVVERGPIASRLPAFDRILNAPDVFLRAHRQFRLTGRLLRVELPDPPDLFHWTYPLPLYVAGSRNVYTILDLIPLRLPYTTLDHKRSYLNLMKAICRRADMIVTISEHSQRDIEAILGPLRCPIVNTYANAQVPPDIRDLADVDLERNLTSVFDLRPRDYYLYVGAMEPRKNLPRLMEAFLRCGSQRPLVLAGPDGCFAERELRLAGMPHLAGLRWDEGVLRSTNKILRFDYLAFRQLMLLIRGARALLLPSLYEGFGLPVLEAMIVGTPVIASSSTSLAEIGGDAVRRVDPLDIGSIVSAIRDVDSEGFDFSGVGRALRADAERFSHERYCQRVASAYAAVLPSFSLAQTRGAEVGLDDGLRSTRRRFGAPSGDVAAREP